VGHEKNFNCGGMTITKGRGAGCYLWLGFPVGKGPSRLYGEKLERPTSKFQGVLRRFRTRNVPIVFNLTQRKGKGGRHIHNFEKESIAWGEKEFIALGTDKGEQGTSTGDCM